MKDQQLAKLKRAWKSNKKKSFSRAGKQDRREVQLRMVIIAAGARVIVPICDWIAQIVQREDGEDTSQIFRNEEEW